MASSCAQHATLAAIGPIESRLTDSGSAPVGLMVAGPALSDQRILAIGLAIEERLHHAA